MKSFQISRLQLFEMIDELFADTVVTCHHEELFTIASNFEQINSRTLNIFSV